MTAPLPLLTEEEVRRVVRDDEEAGFGALRTARGLLPLTEMEVSARVLGTLHATTLRQVFVNTAGVPLEATYIFPLPDRAAVTRFVLEVAGHRVVGDLQERGQARRTYDRAIAQGKRAAIAEEERAGVFTLRVGNLLPGEAATVTLELTGPLSVADGEVTFRFPLVVAPRYMPGNALGGEDVGSGTARDTDAVRDASRISPPVFLPGFSSPVRLSLQVEIDPAGLPLSDVRSSLHAAFGEAGDARRLRVRLQSGERLNRDFVLRFRLGDAQARSTLRLFPDREGATFLLTVAPPWAPQAAHSGKDVVVVLDRSGSMGGWKMVAARRAAARLLEALQPRDRFSLIAFDDRLESPLEFVSTVSMPGRGMPMPSGLTAADDWARAAGVSWLEKLTARGGTEMAPPLSRAADTLAAAQQENPGRDRVLVFITDGQVGNEAQLLKVLGNRLAGSRVFALGIDQAVNAGFLNKLANLGGSGEAELVESEERLDEVLERCHRRVMTPALQQLSIEVQGAELLHDTVAPARLPDAVVGVPALIQGRLRGGAGNVAGGVSIVVRGRRPDGLAYLETVHGEVSDNPAIAGAWGRLHLRDLEDQFDGGRGDRGSLERRIVAVSLAHKVLCRFTAWVAVDDEVVNPGGYQHHVTQAVESVEGARGSSSSGSRPSARAPGAASLGRAQAPAPAKSRRDDSADKEAADMTFSAGLDDDSFDEPTGSGLRREEASAEAKAMPATASAPGAPAPQRSKAMRVSLLAPEPAAKRRGVVESLKDMLTGGGSRGSERVKREAALDPLAALLRLVEERRSTSLLPLSARVLPELLAFLSAQEAGSPQALRLRALYEALRAGHERGDVAALATTLAELEDALTAMSSGSFWR